MRNTNKFHAKKITIDGETFDSQKEYRRWCELKLLAKAGEIGNLRRQVKYILIPTQKIDGKVVERECSYIADFCYFCKGELVCEDVKGYKKGAGYQLFTIKRKLMLERYGIRIKET